MKLINEKLYKLFFHKFSKHFFVFIVIALSYWIAVIYSFENSISKIMLIESRNMEDIIAKKMNHTKKVMELMISEIIKNPQDKENIDKILQNYQTKPQFRSSMSWTIFSWTDNNNQIIVDTKYRIMKKPFDLSNRDYIKKSSKNPGKFFIGEPVYGSTSKKWMIPGGIGVFLNKEYIGSITIGFEIEILADIVKRELSDSNITFYFISSEGRPIFYTKLNEAKACNYFDSALMLPDQIGYAYENIKHFSKEDKFLIKIFGKSRNAIYAMKTEEYPFVIIAQYDKNALEKQFYKYLAKSLKLAFLLVMITIMGIISYKSFKNERK